MFSRSTYRNDPFRSSRKRKRKRNINKNRDISTKSRLKESMKGSWYEQDGVPHERSSDMLHCQHPVAKEN